MIYLDTSALLALYREEPLTSAAERLLETAQTAPGISSLVQVEVASVLARWLRTGEMSAQQTQAVEHAIAHDLEAGEYTTVSMHEACYWQARHWLSRQATALRTLDALHLACADHHGLTLATGDRTLATAAETLAARCTLLEPR